MKNKLNLSKEDKDVYTINADPWGHYEISSENLIYISHGMFEGMQCENQDNKVAISLKCREVIKLIDEIELLNKTP